MTSAPILDVQGLTTLIPTDQGTVVATRGITLQLSRGEVLGLVGESGCGKTTTGLSILRLLRPPGEVVAGQVLFQGRDLLRLSDEQMRRIRGNRLSMIFQNPLNSLNPTETVGAQVGEVFAIHTALKRRERRERVIELLNVVGIPAPNERYNSYPHELSGGMRQRVMIALSLACNPDLVIADEPTTALDLTVQAQILWLLQDLQRRLSMAMIYITHDLAVAASICQRIAVMYAGEVVEEGSTDAIFQQPRHPYTRALLQAIPRTHWRHGRVSAIPGQPPRLVDLDTQACTYAHRCPRVAERCRSEPPQLEMLPSEHLTGERGRRVRCWYSCE